MLQQQIYASFQDENSIDELARLLGGSAITDAVRNNAAEMKNMAKAFEKIDIYGRIMLLI